MSGNFRYEADGITFSGDTLKFASDKARKNFISDTKEMLHALNQKFSEEYGILLWPNLDSYISDLLIFGGSTEHIFDLSISTEDFLLHKGTFGDLDIYIPNANDRGFLLMTMLEKSRGVSLGKFKIIGNKSYPTKDLANSRAIITLLQYGALNSKPTIQFDFMPQPIPVEDEDEDTSSNLKAWVKLSHSSDWNDVKQSLKGVFHKYLLQSLIATRTAVKGTLITPKSPLPPQAIKAVKNADDEMHMISFSVDKGLGKERLIQQMNTDAITGKKYPAMYQGNPIYKKASTEDRRDAYSIKITEIFETAFGFSPNADDLQKMKSFIGLLEIMRTKLYPTPAGKEFCGNVFLVFFNKLFGSEGQDISIFSDAKDFKAKVAAMEAIKQNGFERLINEVLPPEKIEKTISGYYEKFRERMTAKGTLTSKDSDLSPIALEGKLRNLIREIILNA